MHQSASHHLPNRPTHVQFREVTHPIFTPELQRSIDVAWEKELDRSPHLFDGPVVVWTHTEHLDPDGLCVYWARSSFRMRMARTLQVGPAFGSIFVCTLLPTLNFNLIVGKSSDQTSEPGQLQFPGGVLEPPADSEQLDLRRLADHAARELAEETGITLSQPLELWLVKTVANGNLGFFFLAPTIDEEIALSTFNTHKENLAAERIECEFEELLVVSHASEPPLDSSSAPSYLGHVVDMWRTEDRGNL